MNRYLSFLILLFLTGCSTPFFQVPTQIVANELDPWTSTPEHEPLPTDTPAFTSTPTLTPEPSLTPTPTLTPTLALPVIAGTSVPVLHASLNPENAASLKAIGRFGSGILYDAVLSQDSLKLMAAFSVGVRFYDPQTLDEQLFCPLTIPEEGVDGYWQGVPHRFSPDGKYIALVIHNTVQVWRTSDCALQNELPFDPSADQLYLPAYTPQLQFSPDEQSLALVVTRGYAFYDQVYLWRLSDDKLLVSEEHSNGASFSPDGTFFATYDSNSQVLIYKTADGELIHQPEGQRNILSLAFSPDGNSLAACYENWVWFFQTSDGAPLQQFYAKQAGSSCGLSFMTGGKYLIAERYFWNLADGSQEQTPDGKIPWMISPDGAILVTRESVQYNSSTTFWRLAGQTQIAQFGGLKELAISPDSTRAAIVQYEKQDQMLLLNILDGSTVQVVKGENPIFLPDGTSLITWDQENLYQWDAAGGTLLNERALSLSGEPLGHIDRLVFSPDNKTLAALFISGKEVASLGWISLIDTGNLTSHPLTIGYGDYEFAFSPDGTRLAVATRDTVEFWQVSTRQLIGKINTPQYDLRKRSLAFSPDGTLLVLSTDIEINLWNVTTHEKSSSFSMPGGIPLEISFADGQTLVATFESQRSRESLLILNIPGWEIVHQYDYFVGDYFINSYSLQTHLDSPFALTNDGLTLALYAPEGKTGIALITDLEIRNVLETDLGNDGQMAFSRDGQLLLTAFQGGRIQIWDVFDQTLLHTLEVSDHPFAVRPTVEFALSPDGHILATAALGVIELWGVMP